MGQLASRYSCVLRRRKFANAARVVGNKFAMRRRMAMGGVSVLRRILERLYSGVVGRTPGCDRFRSDVTLRGSRARVIVSGDVSAVPSRRESNHKLRSHEHGLGLVNNRVSRRISNSA